MSTEIVLVIVATLFVLAIGIIGYYFVQMVKEFILNEQKKTILEIQKISESEVKRVITPVRLQAYERLILFLERMKPDNLVLRCYQPGMDARMLRDVMITSLRDEYEHNLSQQLYVSDLAWTQIQNAKEEIINLLNSLTPTTEQVSPTAFAGKIFEQTTAREDLIQIAQKTLKQECANK